MQISKGYRIATHFAIFIFVVLIQVFIFILWQNQDNNENELTKSFQRTSKQNLIFLYSNEVMKNYFDAENSFIEYLHEYNPKSLENYQASLSKMTIYLDSLNNHVPFDQKFPENIEHKKQKEKEIIKLQQELDNLIKIKKNPENNIYTVGTKLSPYNYKQVLNSITYDSIRFSDDLVKKGFFSRIGDAFSGNYEFKRDELQIIMKMKYGNTSKSGTVEEQMQNIFKSTTSYYQNEFGNLQNTYSSLRKIDKELLAINKQILKNTQEIILFYNNSAQNSNTTQFQNALEDLQQKRSQIAYLILAMAICTILLLAYSIFAYMYEKQLAKAKAEAEKNVDFKNRIIGMLSHEMRSPLNIISNLTKELKKTKAGIEESDTIDLLNFTSNSLQITVNQILDFFKHENSKLVLYNSKINLKEEISPILESLKSLASVKKIELISNIDSSLNQGVWADNGKIHQLFYNIIGNAIKFTNKGRIRVDGKLSSFENRFRLDINIKDTGIGIPKEDLDKIFDKYYQSKHSKEQISFGAGLGLNLCKEIIELYGGEITVKSELNQGTEISFHLFLDKADNSQETNQAKLIRKFQARKINVAIVDDDRVITTIVKKILSSVNFTVHTFITSESIAEFLKTENVDVILIDMKIGNVSGEDVIKEIKGLGNKNSESPIIIITGNTYKSTLDLKAIQADEIIIKPVDKEELYAKLLKLLK